MYLRLRIAWFTRLTQGVGYEVLAPDQVQPTAEALLAERDHPLAALCGTYLIQAYPAAVSWSLVEQMGERALSEVEQSGDLGELLGHLCWQGYVATTRGQAAQALASGRRIIALTAHGPPPAPTVMINTLLSMGSVGHFAEALAWFDSLVDLSSRSDALLWASVAEHLVEGLYAAGDWDRSDRMATRVLAGDNEPLTAGISWAIRTRIAAGRGEGEAAREYLSRTLEVLPKPGDPGAPLMAAHPAATAAAEVAVLDGAPERALEHLLLALQAPDTVEVSDLAAEILVQAARIALASRSVPAGTIERIREVSEQLHQLGDLGVAWSAEVAALLADAGADPTPSERWREVVAAWERVGHPFDALQARTQLAVALLREGARPAAAQVIAEALQLADELGAVPSAERLRAIARSARLPGHDATRLPGRLSRLSERELEVLRLLAAGRSNGQIAEELFISPKTASVHVSHIIGKLEVANRTEAAAGRAPTRDFVGAAPPDGAGRPGGRPPDGSDAEVRVAFSADTGHAADPGLDTARARSFAGLWGGFRCRLRAGATGHREVECDVPARLLDEALVFVRTVVVIAGFGGGRGYGGQCGDGRRTGDEERPARDMLEKAPGAGAGVALTA